MLWLWVLRLFFFCCYGSVVFLAGGWGGGSRSFTAAAGMEAERKSFGPSPG